MLDFKFLRKLVKAISYFFLVLIVIALGPLFACGFIAAMIIINRDQQNDNEHN